MIDWWGVLWNALWILGLATSLSVVSVGHHQARREGTRLRQALGASDFQSIFGLGLLLTFLGLLLGSRSWWERGIWALPVVLLAAWFLVPWWRVRVGARAQSPAAGAWPSGQVQASADGVTRTGWLGRGLLAAGMLILVAWTLATAVRTVDHAYSLQAHVHQLELLVEEGPASLGALDLARAGEHVAGMHQDLAAIDAALGPLLPLGRLLEWVPAYGGDLAAAADLLDLSLYTAAAGDRTFKALSPVLGMLEGTNGDPAPAPPLGERLLPILVSARPELEAARRELAVAEQSRERIDRGDLSARTAGLVARLDRYLPWFETAVGGALLVPGLLGADGPRTYLVVAQNNHELRATGGFISGVGELHVENGRIVSVDFRDSYAVDNFEVPHGDAPPDLQATLFGQMWLFRDANWSADFAGSAQQMLALYAQDQGVQADGVISLDLAALELLVDAVGPLDVEGIAQPVTRENLQQVIQDRWANPTAGPALGDGQDREWWQHRKDFIGEIAVALLDRVQGGQGLKLGAIAGAVEQVLQEKHLLLYTYDADVLALLREGNWDGTVPASGPDSDFLLVADSNVGFNKVDPNVMRSLRYEIDLSQPQGPVARLTITYRNESRRAVDACIQEARYGETYADMMDRCYWDYVRVYVPSGSRLLAGPDRSLPSGSLLAQNGGKAVQLPAAQDLRGRLAVWNAFFDLAPGQERTLTFDYELPIDLLEQMADGLVRYHLRVQKQPGTMAVPLAIQLSLPGDAQLVQETLTNPESWTQREPAGMGNTLLLSTDLRVDREVEVVFHAGHSRQ